DCELVGRSVDELLGKPLLEALPELEGQGFDDLLKQVIATGVPYIANEVEASLNKSGQIETIYVDLVYRPRFDNNEDITGIFVVATDVTQQVISRRKVEASELQLRSLVESAPFPIGVYI